MPKVYPTSYLVLTTLSILFSFTNAALTAFNISQFMLFINASIAGLTFIYHITLLVLAYRRSLRSHLAVVPRLFIGSQWSNIIILTLMVGLWAVSLSLSVNLLAQGPPDRDDSDAPTGAEWNLGVQTALVLLAGLQIITLVAFIWTAVGGRLKFRAEAERRAAEHGRVHAKVPKMSIERPSFELEKEPTPATSNVQGKLSSLPKLTIPPVSYSTKNNNTSLLPKSIPRAKLNHSASRTTWDFVTPEVQSSPSAATTTQPSQFWAF